MLYHPNSGQVFRTRSEAQSVLKVLSPALVEPTIPAPPEAAVNQIVTLSELPVKTDGIWTYEWKITPLTAEQLYPTADAAKSAVKGWIERLLNQITDKYPRHEIDSWATKNEAARAVKAGSARSDQTGMIQFEADQVGATLADQADAIISKADQFAAIISLTSGMRQQVGAALDAASTPAEYEAVVNAALVTASVAAAQHGLSV